MNHASAFFREPRGNAFRLSLPESALRPLPEPEPEVKAAMERNEALRRDLDVLGFELPVPACGSDCDAPLFDWSPVRDAAELPVPACPVEAALVVSAPQQIAADPEHESRRGSVRGDVRLFLATYAACFVAVSLFIF